VVVDNILVKYDYNNIYIDSASLMLYLLFILYCSSSGIFSHHDLKLLIGLVVELDDVVISKINSMIKRSRV